MMAKCNGGELIQTSNQNDINFYVPERCVYSLRINFPQLF